MLGCRPTARTMMYLSTDKSFYMSVRKRGFISKYTSTVEIDNFSTEIITIERRKLLVYMFISFEEIQRINAEMVSAVEPHTL